TMVQGAAARAEAIFDAAGLGAALRDGARPGLTSALAALEEEEGLSREGHAHALASFSDAIRRLALIEADRQRFPGIADVKIAPTHFVLGLPRCGTSVLHALLGEDPNMRIPRMWEISEPSPPPTSEGALTDPRIAAHEAWVESTYAGNWEDLRKAHPFGAMMPQEDTHILNTAFCSFLPSVAYRLPAHYRHYLEADTTFGYQVHAMWLQHLQYRHERPTWAVKVQEHVYHMPELRSVYPDARFIHCHRDPVQVMASICKLIATLRSRYFTDVDPFTLGREMLSMWHDGEVRMIEYRKAHPDLPVYDMPFRRLMADPVAAIRDLYDKFDLPFTPEYADAIRAWLAANPADKHGKHVYALADYGLSEGEVREIYGDYIDYFGEFL
ncbi:MAG: sulfotransferase, partial [Sphingobium sp.]